MDWNKIPEEQKQGMIIEKIKGLEAEFYRHQDVIDDLCKIIISREQKESIKQESIKQPKWVVVLLLANIAILILANLDKILSF